MMSPALAPQKPHQTLPAFKKANNSLYQTEEESDGFTEEYQGYLGTDIDEKNTKAYHYKKQKEYEEKIESQIGNIPYKRNRQLPNRQSSKRSITKQQKHRVDHRCFCCFVTLLFYVFNLN
jgi:hypothetical protein